MESNSNHGLIIYICIASLLLNEDTDIKIKITKNDTVWFHEVAHIFWYPTHPCIYTGFISGSAQPPSFLIHISNTTNPCTTHCTLLHSLVKMLTTS